MASFFDDLEQKITDTGRDVMQKTKDTTETLRLKGMISDEQKVLDSVYQQIGALYFKKYGQNPDSEFASLIDSAQSAVARIDDYNKQIEMIKGATLCPQCGAPVPPGSQFCNNCGFKLQAKSNTASCKQCGAPLSEGAAFCTNCGCKVEQAPSESCSFCGAPLSLGAAFCTNCGTPVAPSPVNATPASEPVNEPAPTEVINEPEATAAATCSFCGASLREGAAFCTSCGVPVAPAAPEAPQAPVAPAEQPLHTISVASPTPDVEPQPSCEVHPAPQATEPAVAATCGFCGASLREGAAFCTNCGTPAAPANQPAPASPADGIALCPSCGKPTKPGAKFCTECGTTLC